ncbi:RHS repeat-associated core domain-containing protein [Saccharothrix saharensis]|uniref:RHS repeat-associated core domain-containing protein n=1 Tax=Saccharothrix saharensis TaxID=571190 RepID=UPI003685D23A
MRRDTRSGLSARGGALCMVAVLTATLVQVPAAPFALAAGGPSVPLPGTPSVPVTRQGNAASPAGDETTPRAMSGDQPGGASSLPGSGDFGATSLSPSATWQVSAQTGDFTWSYPIPVPPAAGGLQPALGLSYSSSAVDGLTSATNNQASWVGDGWSMWPGFVERTYRGCAEDVGGDDEKPGDLCWHTDNATLSLNGSGTQLIRDDASGVWKPANDDGSKVERVTASGNGDDDGESWQVTTVDGTRYLFGSAADAKSTWTVPVYGDDAGEPCHGDTFAGSWCVQAYRWNLDQVVDRHGNVIRYSYQTEKNHYGRNKSSAAAEYVRGGWLDRADYGLRADDATVPASHQVQFDVVDRCVPGSDCVLTKPANLPDVPLDLKCDGGSCGQNWSPTFWTTKQLRTITTKSRSGGGYAAVDSWTLRHELPDPGDGEKAALWLKGITHTGHTGTAITLPEVTFDGARKPNRVTGTDGYAKVIRFRMNAIISESGGVTSIDYAEPDCVPGSPAPEAADTNTKRCFPVRWKPKMSPERSDYFHKYVVASVASHDGIAGTVPVETAYEYLDGAAWHRSTSEFVEEEDKTWNEFRGFGRVRIRTGTGHDGPRTMTEQRFHRGMHGDKLRSGTRQAFVTDSEGRARPDEDWLRGTLVESATFEREAASNQPDPVRTSKTITEPTWHGPTATRAAYKAYIVRTGKETTYVPLAAGGRRVTSSTTEYDRRWGLPTVVDGEGDVSTDADDLCTTTTYAPNEENWLIDFPARVESVSIRCGLAPVFPDDAISDIRTSYDRAAAFVKPSKGDITRMEVAVERPATGTRYVVQGTTEYDRHGRITKSTNAAGHSSTTAYTPAVGGPVTQVVSTTPGTAAVPAGLATTTTYQPSRGLPTSIVDPNNRRTELTYDALGRTTEVWLPNRPKTANPDGNLEYGYHISATGPSVVTTTALGPNGNYTTTHELYDGLLRKRQVQAPAPGGGRLLSDSRYDSHGRLVKTTRPYFNDAPVDKNLWLPTDNAVPAMTVIEHDTAGRPVAEVFLGNGTEKWRTTKTYGGDRQTITPPAGGTTTTTISNARGQVVELRQHGPTGYDAGKYTYTPAGDLASVTDAGGNTWSYTYDLRGRRTSETDPDRGRSTTTYDDLGQVRSTTDARGVTLVYDYDALGRRTSLHQDSATGPRLADWTYDTAAYGKGHVATATRRVGGNAYTTAVGSYTPLYQPAQVDVEIPQSETGLAGRYRSYLTYAPDGSPASETYPAAGGLPAEGVTHTYTDLGLPAATRGGFNGTNHDYVAASDYTRYGELQRLQLGEGTKRAWLSNYFEDQTRRLTRSIVDGEVPNPMQSDTRYHYDPVGNVTSIADTPTGGAADVQCFRYDHLRRLTEAWTPTTGCDTDPTVGELGGAAPYWHSYGYDKVGNRVSEVQHAAAGDTTRTYAHRGHTLESVTTASPGGTTLASFRYDANGNTTSRLVAGEQQTLRWDPESRLVAEESSRTAIVYDADGGRLIRREGDSVTLYLGNQEIRVDLNTGAKKGTRYYNHGDQTVAVRTEAGLSWLAADHQGTAKVSIDSSTLSVTRRRHLPFGEERGRYSWWPDEGGFVGGTVDGKLGLTHLGAREYDPTLGRFLSVDPLMDLSDPQQTHGYTYGNNNPVTFADPSGLIPDYCVDGSVSCHGYHPHTGCPGGCGTTANQEWWQGVESAGEEAQAAALQAQGITEEQYRDLQELMYDQRDGWQVTLDLLVELLGEISGFNSIRGCLKGDGVMVCVEALIDVVPWNKIPKLLGNLGKVFNAFRRGASWASDVAEARDKVTKVNTVVDAARAAARSCAAKNSFPGDTLVLMADGSTKRIDQVEVGDKVANSEPESERTEQHDVVGVIVSHADKGYVDLTITTPDGPKTVKVTGHHPFYNATAGLWTDAADLQEGTLLATPGNGRAFITAVRDYRADLRTYNLTVESVRTYYVLAGATPVLVHNCPMARDAKSLQGIRLPRTYEGLDIAHVRSNHFPGGAGVNRDKHMWPSGTTDEQLEGIARQALKNGPKVVGYDKSTGMIQARSVVDGTLVQFQIPRGGGEMKSIYPVG